MAGQANSTTASIFRLVPNTGHSSQLFDLIRDYRWACEEEKKKVAVFDHVFKRLPKRARVNEVMDREITEMQSARQTSDRAKLQLLNFIDVNF